MLKRIREECSGPDIVFYSVFGLLSLYLLVNLAFHPFGFISRIEIAGLGWAKLHTITPFCLCVLSLWFWHESENVSIPKRLLLIMLFCWLSYQTYDIVWNIDLWLFDPFGFPITTFFNRLICAYLFPLSVVLYLTRKRWNPHVLTIHLKPLLVVWIINFILILWLESTGFYDHFFQWWYWEGPDPHGWVWLLGKAVGMLSLALAVKKGESKTSLETPWYF